MCFLFFHVFSTWSICFHVLCFYTHSFSRCFKRRDIYFFSRFFLICLLSCDFIHMNNLFSHVILYTWHSFSHDFFFFYSCYLFTLKRYDSFICTCDLLTVLVHMWFLKINLFSYLISYTWIIYFRMWFYTHELFIFTWLFYTLFIYFHLWIYWFSCKKSHSFMFTCNFLLHD